MAQIYTTPGVRPAPDRPPAPDSRAAPIVMNDVTKMFGPVGVEHLTLTVPEGSIMGLVGPSGCGKTTTVRLLLGVYRQDGGAMTVLGENPAHLSTRTRARIGYMPQHYVLSPRMTVWSTMEFVASLYGMTWFRRRKALRQALQFVELDGERGKLVSDLSGGMQRRLALASMLAPNPTLIFADEPTAGIDPVLRVKFWEHFRALRDTGHTLLVTTQYVGEISYCDRVAVMRDGRLLTVDTPEGLRRQALGGEPFALEVRPDRQREAFGLIDRQPEVRRARLSRSRPGVFYVTVDDAAAAVPRLTRLLNDAGIDVKHVEEYRPSFDEIFVDLMQRLDPQPEQQLRASEEAPNARRP